MAPISKVKYYYDKETLTYTPVERNRFTVLSNFILFLLASIFAGVVSLFILLNTDTLHTPKELLQAREIENFELQYELLNKKLEQIEEVISNVEDRDNNLYRVYFEASPIPEEQRKMGFGGINRYKELEGYENSKLIINTTKRLEILTKQLVVQSRSLEEIESLAKRKEELLGAMPSIQPIHKSDLKRMASGFGYRTDPLLKKEDSIKEWTLQLQKALRFMLREMELLEELIIGLQVMESIFVLTMGLGI